MVDLVHSNLLVHGNDRDEVSKLAIAGIKTMKHKQYFLHQMKVSVQDYLFTAFQVQNIDDLGALPLMV